MLDNWRKREILFGFSKKKEKKITKKRGETK
jgi:hypothetical protein